MDEPVDRQPVARSRSRLRADCSPGMRISEKPSCARHRFDPRDQRRDLALQVGERHQQVGAEGDEHVAFLRARRPSRPNACTISARPNPFGRWMRRRTAAARRRHGSRRRRSSDCPSRSRPTPSGTVWPSRARNCSSVAMNAEVPIRAPAARPRRATRRRSVGPERSLRAAMGRHHRTAARGVDRDEPLARDHLDEIGAAPAHPAVRDADHRDAVRRRLVDRGPRAVIHRDHAVVVAAVVQRRDLGLVHEPHLLPRLREAAVLRDVKNFCQSRIFVAAQRRVDHVVADDARLLGIVADAAQRPLAERPRLATPR